MHRQKFNVRKGHVSQEPLPTRGLYCRKCQQPVKRRDALHAGSKRSRCPACGEVLEFRPENGQADEEGPPPKD